TREISFSIKVTWHPVVRHCELLESYGKISKMAIGHSNIWFLPERQGFPVYRRKKG
ncbi:MAG: hypothetical protein HYW25_04365, partial [Candidatus Aenigmarchaeota archaeon]|nr:hypothetical protein [Candidatus Aenigmarchaeota archaeon]